jgi:hypothetical protein
MNNNSTVNRWRFVMKTLLTLGAALAVLLLIAMPVASQAPQADKSFSGTLTKVDAAKKVITVKGTGAEPEMTFIYDDKTQVTGAEKTVEGLAGKSGAMHCSTSQSSTVLGRKPIPTTVQRALRV